MQDAQSRHADHRTEPLERRLLLVGEVARVADINPTPSGDNPAYELEPLGNAVFFSANDALVGRELWITDGTTSGTRLVRDLRAGPLGS